MKFRFLIFTFLSLLFFTCKKDPKTEVVTNNTAPYYDKIARVKIENYVNRLYIDLIGREAFDSELATETDQLIANDLSMASRDVLISKLQFDKTHRPGDSSYCIAYHKRLYDLLCVRLCEGAGQDAFLFDRNLAEFAAKIDSLNGNWASFYNNKKVSKECLWAARARWDFMNDSFDIHTYCIRLVNNTTTFNKTLSYASNEDNTIKYTFNDFLFRNYTGNEFLIARDMILFGKTGILFGRSGHSKGDYFDIICDSQEFYEGTLKWLYKTFISRFPTAQETMDGLNIIYSENKKIYTIQRNILKSDEYANF